MRSYERFIGALKPVFFVVGVIVAVLLFGAGVAGIAYLVQTTDPHPTDPASIRALQCIDAGGRTVKIDGVKACFKLTIVPDSVADGGFWSNDETQCRKIPEAVWTNLDGTRRSSRACYYFELIRLPD